MHSHITSLLPYCHHEGDKGRQEKEGVRLGQQQQKELLGLGGEEQARITSG